MDIYDITVKPSESVETDKVLVTGQKVRITRMATYTYEVEIRDYLDYTDNTDISVKDLISEEEGEDGIRHNPGILRVSTIEDDVVISVEII